MKANFESERETSYHCSRTIGSSQDFSGQTKTGGCQAIIVIQAADNGDLSWGGETDGGSGHVYLVAQLSNFLQHHACQVPLSMGILQARILEWVAMPSSRRRSSGHEGELKVEYDCIWHNPLVVFLALSYCVR